MIRVSVIASTILHRDRVAKETPYAEHPFPSDIETVLCADELAEFVGRTVYQSWDRPNRRTETNEAYLAEVINHSFLNTLEHAHATFYIAGLSESSAAALAEHKSLSVARVDQRFVDSRTAEYVVPPAFELDDDADDRIGNHFEETLELFDWLTCRCVSNGMQPTEARKAASAVLPGCLQTEVVATGSMRAWREVIDKADVGDELADALLKELCEVAPNSFQDMIPEPVDYLLLTA